MGVKKENDVFSWRQKNIVKFRRGLLSLTAIIFGQCRLLDYQCGKCAVKWQVGFYPPSRTICRS